MTTKIETEITLYLGRSKNIITYIDEDTKKCMTTKSLQHTNVHNIIKTSTS